MPLVPSASSTTVAPSVTTWGTATSPGAGATITSTASVPPGAYRIAVYIILTGTAETALLNLQLQTADGVVMQFGTFSGAGLQETELENVTTTGAGIISLKTIAAGVGGSIYTAWIVVSRIG